MANEQLDEAHRLLGELQISPDVNGKYFSGYCIWLGASTRDAGIRQLAKELTEVFEDLGAEVMTSEQVGKEYESLPRMREQTKRAQMIMMLAASPGVSARTLEMCFESRDQKSECRGKTYVYIPEQYHDGFIHRRFCHYNLKIRSKDQAQFAGGRTAVLRQCISDMTEFAVNTRRQAMQREKEFKPEIGIVTALPVEFKAASLILTGLRVDAVRAAGGPYQEYHHGTIASQHGGNHNVVVARAGKGNNKAAVLATSLLTQYPSVEVLLMVGVAAGVPNVKSVENHVRLGDIVVSDEAGVIQYDMIKRYTSKAEYTAPPRPPDPKWLTRAENFIALSPARPKYWSYLDDLLKELEGRRPPSGPLRDSPWVDGRTSARQPPRPPKLAGRPKVHSGPIASANTVLKSAGIRDKIRNLFHIKAIEMEASGLAESAWQSGKGYLVIRGICDYANDDKNKVWQPYAAAAAAAFARELIETMGPHTAG
ncbi:MAG TPA: 5'-methylthioadenosine/S-adenosylhomocysteine nucleosidase [Tepidisphaeraceae bacterium]|jgi:nucleoside phosphorylase|nr:5'-methylthioadenosine/S-adenosylhomocysteine nucleosidase [Tepidisphaeraceae bacterium]